MMTLKVTGITKMCFWGKWKPAKKITVKEFAKDVEFLLLKFFFIFVYLSFQFLKNEKN